MIQIDSDKCEACEECVDACPSAVFEIVNGKSEPVNIDECVECCSCVEICPNGAINHESCT
jgi:NAD-dependent dihydropyrimidine dehydrogenase PreA subunit